MVPEDPLCSTFLYGEISDHKQRCVLQVRNLGLCLCYVVGGSMSMTSTRDWGMAKSSERIKSQHLYHVTFFRNVISDAFRMHFGHFSERYPKCIPNASEMYQKSIPNSNKNTIFLQNKPTIRPETNQISSIHCKK